MTSSWPVAQRLQRQAVVDAGAGSQRARERVGARQRRPAVGAGLELVREPEAQRLLRSWRQARQVAQAAQAELLRIGLAHRQRVAVVKAQPRQHEEPTRRQQRIELRGVGLRPLLLEQFAQQGAAVLGVDIDLAGLQRRRHDGGVAQALAVLRRLAAGLQGLGDQLTEQVAFGEAL